MEEYKSRFGIFDCIFDDKRWSAAVAVAFLTIMSPCYAPKIVNVFKSKTNISLEQKADNPLSNIRENLVYAVSSPISQRY